MMAREMKDTNIEWFPKIPQNWKESRIKNVIAILTDYTANGSFGDLAKNVQYLDYEDYARLVRLTDLREDLKNDGIYVSQASYEYLSKSKLFGEEILIANVGAYAGLFCEMPKTNKRATLGPNMFLIKTNGEMIQHYLFYLGNSKLVKEQLLQKSVSAAQPKLNKNDVKTVFIPVPCVDEQKIITNYLDKKCVEIDALSSDIQSQIDILEDYKKSVITEAVTKGINPGVKLTDSKIFYLDKFNYNWKLSKIGYICSKLSRSFSPADVPLICSNKGKVLARRENITGIMASDDNAMQGIKDGDIAIHGMDTWHGAIALSEYSGKITRVVHVCDSTEDKRFVVYWLQYLAFQGVYKLISNGVRENTSDFRSWDKVKDIYIVLPDKEEQKAICDYLDDVCSKVDATVELKKKQLETLEEYKNSLIYEYVTGKREVPDNNG